MLLSLPAAAPASAGAWLAPVDLSASEANASGARVAVNPRGDAVAVWSAGVVQSAVRVAGGAWQPPVDLSAPDGVPHVAIDARGNAIAVW